MSRQGCGCSWIRWRNRYRKYVSVVLAMAAATNAAMKFWGEWELFFGALIGHGLFWQLIVAFLYNKNMNVGGGGADLSDGPAARGIVITFAIIGYGAMFFFNGYPWR